MKWIAGIIAVIAMFTWAGRSGNTSSPSSSDLPRQKLGDEFALEEIAICAPDSSDLIVAAKAAAAKDTTTLQSMIGRGRVYALGVRERLEMRVPKDGHSEVRVLSGSHAGDRCEIPNSMLP